MTETNSYSPQAFIQQQLPTKSHFLLDWALWGLAQIMKIEIKRMFELKEMRLSRDHPGRLIDSALNRATSIPRKLALRRSKKKKETTKNPVFAIKYDPRLPSIQSIQAKHWRSMASQNQYLKECFQEPPFPAFKKPKNLRELLI